MRKRAFGWLCVGLLCVAGTVWAGEAVGAAPDVAALKEQLKELNETVNAVRAKRDGLRAKIAKSPDLAPLREAYDKTLGAYEARKKIDPAYVDARAAEDQARNEYAKLIKEKVAASDEGKTVLADIESIRKQMAELREAESLARRKFDELRRNIQRSDDADIKAALEKIRAAGKARDEARKGEILGPLRQARDEAQRAYYAKRKELEEADDELQATIKEREELRVQVGELHKKIREAEK
jgi:hypothetical protein